MKKILTWLLFLSFGLLVWQFWLTEQEKKREAAFDMVVDPIKEDMSYYRQLDLTFLQTWYSDLDTQLQKNPNQYIQQLKQSFASSLQAYQNIHPWELPLEIASDALLASMSLEQKVAQLFMFWFEGTNLSEQEKNFLETYTPGGIIVMWKNVSTSLSEMITQMQATQEDLPLFVAVDQEGDQVKRIPEELPGQAYVTLEATCDVYKTRSNLLHDLGINMNFWIVADITNDTNSFIYPRVFQGDVLTKVARASTCTHTTLSTLKHFPWHGGTTQDTHQGIKTLDIEKTTREEADLQPFVSGIWVWADALMMWHLKAPFLDAELPATLSPATNTYVRELWFTWLVVTDDMWMIASNGEQFTQLEEALVAGNDLILYVDGSDKQKILDHAISFVKEWGVALDDIDTRLRRIVQKKQKIIAMDDFVSLELVK